MSDFSRLPTRGDGSGSSSNSSSPAPPPPPPPASVQPQPRYSNRAASALARFAQPFFSGSRPPSPQTSAGRADSSAGLRSNNRSKSLPGESQTVTHKTGIPIAALDISPQRTHAVIGGKEILKTIRVSPDHSSEEFNLRNAIVGYSSTHHVGGGLSARQKDQLTVRDVKWSHGNHDRTIATAVANGRIVLYDLNRVGLEYCRLLGHSRQVHRLAFNKFNPSLLLSGSQDSSIRLWDLRFTSIENGVSVCRSKEQFNGNSDAIRDIRWCPIDGMTFATATDSGAVQLWDIRKTFAPVMRITAHDRPCYSVDWHPDGKHIVSGGMDRQVKVWEFTPSSERRQKPTFQFRTPQAVMNVRWRPPSWAKEPVGSGDWQSTQVVTSYDKEDPRIHLWDLRRPHIPFREFDRYDSNAADLLWHSKDLLWTAGDAGAFTQTDIRYAPQVVNRRPMCSVAWSPSGEVLAFAQKRPRRNTLGLSTTEFIGSQEEETSSADALSQSPVDDLLDEPSFTLIQHRRSKSASAARSRSLGSTPPGLGEENPVLSLEKSLSKVKTSGPHQLGINGSIPGATMSREVFQYLARHYAPLFDDLHGAYTDSLPALLESLGRNAECAEDISLVKLAQTWRIIKFAVIQELELKAREARQPGSRGIKKKPSKEGAGANKSRAAEDGRHDRMKNRLFKGITEVPMHSLNDAEPTSSMTTPLARPLPDSPVGSLESSGSHMTSLNDSDIQPLPASVLSSNQGTMNSNDWSSMSDIEPRPIIEFQRTRSNASEGVQSINESLSSDLIPDPGSRSTEEDQRSAPLAINQKSDWHVRRHPRIPEEDEYDQKMEDKRAAIRDYKSFPKKVLSLESHMESSRPGFQRHESSESFPMFSASTESSHPAKSMATSFSSATKGNDDENEDLAEESDTEVNDTPHETITRARGDSVLRPGSVRDEEMPNETINEATEESPPDTDCIHLERPSSPPVLLMESTPLDTLRQGDDLSSTRPISTLDRQIRQVLSELGRELSDAIIPMSVEETGSKPWSAAILLREAIQHHHSSTNTDIQSAAHLLQKLRLLFEDCEKILPHEECELIFSSYNEHLMRQSMYIEAAELRLLCVPSYPPVYEYAQIDTTMNVFCFTCKRPYENPVHDNGRCHRCNTPQEPCTICMSLEPPPEWVVEQSTPSTHSSQELPSEITSLHLSQSGASQKTESIPPAELQQLDEKYSDTYQPPRPKGATLWTWCQGCGHGGHLACMRTWLNDFTVSEGGCATPGCLHDCGPGPRREHNRAILLEESKKRDSASRKAGVGFVKRDAWARGESKAVEKVRGMLNANAPGGVAGAGPGVSPKKVRLVTPSEQGKRRAHRSSMGSGGGLGE